MMDDNEFKKDTVSTASVKTEPVDNPIIRKSSFVAGDLVWAKMKHYPYWPAKVVDDDEVASMNINIKRKKSSNIPVRFFGSQDFQFMDASAVLDYFGQRRRLALASKLATFKTAVAAAEEHIANTPALVQLTKMTEQCDVAFTGDDRDRDYDEAMDNLPTAERSASLTENDDELESTSSKRSSAHGEFEPEAKSKKTEKRPFATSLGSSTKVKTSCSNGSTAQNSMPAAAASLNTPQSVRKALMGKISHKIIGFIGMGNMGAGMLKNLADAGHRLVLYSRSIEKCSAYLRDGQTRLADSPSDLMRQCDVVFSCVSDKEAVRDILGGPDGIFTALKPGKAYVEMCTLDMCTSVDIHAEVTKYGARFLEAPICGTKQDAVGGNLVFLCSGDRQLFEDCESMFHAMGRRALYLGEITNGTKAKLVFQLLQAVITAGVAECLALADRVGLSQQDIADILELTNVASPLVKSASKAITDGIFAPSFRLELMQNDLQKIVELGHVVEQPLPITASANELFKLARKRGQSSLDYTAVYRALTDI